MAKENSNKEVMCSRCNVEMEYKGTKNFHEGTRWGAMGELGELFVNKEKYDIYVCPQCGVVEFFVDQIGEELRQQ
jgi:hypothetical protein